MYGKKFLEITNSLFNSSHYYFYLPLIIFFLGFLETFGIIGFFIPMEIISITVYAFLIHHKKLLIFSTIVFFLGIIIGSFAGYFFGKHYYKDFMNFLEKKFPALKDYFLEIDKYFDKYHIFAFPIIINIGFLRPIIAMHLGARNYDRKKFFLGSILGAIFYIIPRIIIGSLVGIYGKIIIDKLKIGYKYILIGALIIIIISFIADFFIGEKELEKGKG